MLLLLATHLAPGCSVLPSLYWLGSLVPSPRPAFRRFSMENPFFYIFRSRVGRAWERGYWLGVLLNEPT